MSDACSGTCFLNGKSLSCSFPNNIRLRDLLLPSLPLSHSHDATQPTSPLNFFLLLLLPSSHQHNFKVSPSSSTPLFHHPSLIQSFRPTLIPYLSSITQTSTLQTKPSRTLLPPSSQPAGFHPTWHTLTPTRSTSPQRKLDMRAVCSQGDGGVTAQTLELLC